MTLTEWLIVVWTGVAAGALPFCLYVALDAYQDVQARHANGLNSGRETLAQLLVITSLLTSLVFGIWFCLGIYILFVRPRIEAAWEPLVTPAGLVLAELVLAGAMIYKQQVRMRVLRTDMNSEAVKKQAAADLIGVQREANTAALIANTAATTEATHAMQNGPMAAQIDNTRSTDANTNAIDVHTQIEIKKLEEEQHE